MEKQYLDYNGLTDVAGHVNTRLKTVTTMPVSADNGAVRLYAGTTTDTYIRGHIYQYNSTDSEWVDITSLGQYIQYSTMPTASIDIVNKIVQYTGTTNQNYTNGYFYKCTLSGSNYIWTNINVQAGGSGSDNIINGYFNPTDNLFYEESTYTTAITGENNVLYISLDTDFSYRYNGSIFVRVDKEIDDTTTSSSKTWSSNKISSEITGIIGSIVTPTDDIQTWLKCANLTESYTTLSSVLADDDVMEKLFRSENACDYLVRSTTWASDITADQTAMILIGKNDYCADILMENSTWSAAISTSSYWDSVLEPLVHKMTSNITPYGVASADSEIDTAYAYKAFDGTIASDNTWASSKVKNTEGIYLQYQFISQIIVKKFKIIWSNYWTSCSYQLQGSNDGSNFTTIDSYTDSVSGLNWITHNVDNNNKYQYYRVNVTAQTGDNTYGGHIVELQFYGRASKTTIYSAANDIVSFVDDEGAKVVKTDATGKGEVNIVCKPNTDITFTSSIAKNPNNLSENYSKVVTVKTGELVYVMPNKNVLYWWGYKSSNLEDISSANGWTYTSYTFDTPTYNTNSIDLPVTSSMHSCGVGTKTSCKLKKATLVSNGIVGYTFNDFYTCSSIGILSNKNFNSASLARCGQGIAKTELEMSSFGDYYIQTFVNNGQSSSIYALWYDSDDADDKAEISAIATNEPLPTSSRDYKCGEHFYKNGMFCTCTQAIAQGAQFTLGTNYIEGTVADSIGYYIDVDLNGTAVTTYANGMYYGSKTLSRLSGYYPCGWCWLDQKWDVTNISLIVNLDATFSVGLLRNDSKTYNETFKIRIFLRKCS